MMEVVKKAIRILVVFYIFGSILCHDGYNEQDNIQMKHISSNDGQVEAITSYSTNVIQNNPNSQSLNVNGQYRMVDDSGKTTDYDRLDRGRIRKIYRIKNPFQQQEEEEEESSKQDIKTESQDSKTGASNQYTSMQYSLPPEEFLQRLRANNQYYQHQQQQQQDSTPVSTFGYTATPQPQYQYSTIPTTFNNGNPQNSVLPPTEHKSPPQTYDSNFNNYQYNNGYSFGIEAIQSTPSSVTLYLSTNSPNNQFVGTPTSNYVSSSSPIYQSSPTNVQSYISSTLSNVQTGSPNFNNNINRNQPVVEGKSFNYGSSNRDAAQNIHVNHYDNSANGVQHPMNMQQQYQIDFPSSTQSPISSTFSDINQESWINSMNYNANNAQNSRQEFVQTDRYSSLGDRLYDTTRDPNQDNQNTDTHRVGNMPSANNIFLSFARPEHQAYTNVQNDRDMEPQQNRQTEVYSHGDYGWKLDGKKPLAKYDVSLASSSSQQQSNIYPSNSNYLNSNNRIVDNGKIYDDSQAAKLTADKLAAHEFAKAAAKAHENMRKEQELYSNSYAGQTRFSPDSLVNSDSNNVAYKSTSNNQNSVFQSNQNTYNGVPQSHYYFANSRDSDVNNKFKQLINEKGLQSIIYNDVSSISPDTNPQIKFNLGPEVNTRYNFSTYNNEQNLKPLVETHNNDKTTLNNYNVRTRLEENAPPGNTNKLEPNFELQKQYDILYNANNPYSQPHSNLILKPGNYFSQPSFDNKQQHNNLQQLAMQRPQNQGNQDNVVNLKLGDVPYWLSQGFNTGKLQLQNGIENVVSTVSPLLLNQNIEAHQLDVAASILNRLIRNKPIEVTSKPDFNNMGSLLSNINGLKVANPYNLDLKLVSEILKGRTSFNNNNMPFNNQLNQPHPLHTLDTSQLQQLMLKNDNFGNLALSSHEGMGTVSPFYEININSNFPQQGIKYSRSQEEEESLIPLTDTTQNLQIGSVIEGEDILNESKEIEDSDVAGTNDNNFSVGIKNDKPKLYSGRRFVNPILRQINSLVPDAPYHYNRKIPKMVMREPYPLLKPPPVHNAMGRNRKNLETFNRRQRANKLKFSRLVKREPAFEEEDYTKDGQPIVPTILRPPPTTVEDKFDASESDEI